MLCLKNDNAAPCMPYHCQRDFLFAQNFCEIYEKIVAKTVIFATNFAKTKNSLNEISGNSTKIGLY
jgi:hypothetical protein